MDVDGARLLLYEGKRNMASTSRNIFCFKLLIEDHMAGLLTKEIWRIPIIPDRRFLDFSFVCLTIWWPAQQH